jgi:hypothetical protein
MADKKSSNIKEYILPNLLKGIIKSIPALGALLEQFIFGTLDSQKAEEEKNKLLNLIIELDIEHSTQTKDINEILNILIDKGDFDSRILQIICSIRDLLNENNGELLFRINEAINSNQKIALSIDEIKSEITSIRDKLPPIVTNSSGLSFLCCNSEQNIDNISNNPFSVLTDGLLGLPNDPLSGLEQFLIEYIGSPLIPAIFGGRTEEISILNNWLIDDNSKPYMLLIESAGSGKSALVAQWAFKIATQKKADVVLVPISIRFGTAQKGSCFSLFGQRLRYLRGKQSIFPQDPSFWIGEISISIREDRLSSMPPLLIILDGIDEATDWRIDKDIRLPPFIGKRVKILISGRSLADCSMEDWQQRLAVKGISEFLSLTKLNTSDIRTILELKTSKNIPLLDLNSLSNQLFRLSNGDPLLLRFYIDAIVGTSTDKSFLNSSDLNSINPGLTNFFKRWWSDHLRLWGSDAVLREKNTLAVISILACALGPLSIDDILWLGSIYKLNKLDLQDFIIPILGRFIVGNSKVGYTFCHPKLNYFFRDDILSISERKTWESMFLQYGEYTITAIKRGKMDAKCISPYIVRYYGAHLVQSNSKINLFTDLVTKDWLNAWKFIDYHYFGFLSDVEKVVNATRESNKYLIRTNNSAKNIINEIKCALCFASVNSISSNIPEELLLLLVKNGLWNIEQAIGYIERVRRIYLKANMYSSVSFYMNDSMRIHALKSLLLGFEVSALNYKHGEGKSGISESIHAIATIIDQLPVEQKIEIVDYYISQISKYESDLYDDYNYWNLIGLKVKVQNDSLYFEEIFRILKNLKDHNLKCLLLIKLAEIVNEPYRQKLISEAIILAKNIKNISERAIYFNEVSKIAQEKVALQKMAWNLVIKMNHNNSSRLELSYLACELGEVNNAIKIIKEHKVGYYGRFEKALALCKIANYTDSNWSNSLVAEAINYTLNTGFKDENVPEYLIELIKNLPKIYEEKILKLAIEKAFKIRDKKALGKVLCSIAEYVTDPIKNKFIDQAFTLVQYIGDEYQIARTIVVISRDILGLNKKKWLTKAIKLTLSVNQVKANTGQLIKLLEILPPEYQQRVFRVAVKQAISHEPGEDYINPHQYLYLSKISPFPKINKSRIMSFAKKAMDRHSAHAYANILFASGYSLLLDELLNAISENSDTTGAACIIAESAKFLTKNEVINLLKIVNQIQSGHDRAIALGGIAPKLADEGLVEEAFDVIEMMGNYQFFKPEALIEMLPFLSADYKKRAQKIALNSIRMIKEDSYVEVAFAIIGPAISESFFVEALQLIYEIGSIGNNKGLASSSFEELIPHIPASYIVNAWNLFDYIYRNRPSRYDKYQTMSLLFDREIELGLIEQSLNRLKKYCNNKRYLKGMSETIYKVIKRLVELNEIKEAKNMINIISSPRYKIKALGCLVNHISDNDFKDAIQLIFKDNGNIPKAEAIEPFIPRLNKLQRSELYNMWISIHNEIHTCNREEYLQILCILMPLVKTLGGTNCLENILKIIYEVYVWWN